MNKRSIAVSAGVLVFLVIAAGGVYALKAGQGSGDQHGGMPPTAVEVIAATTTEWAESATLVGTVIAQRSVSLSPEVNGMVKDVLFESDTVVRAGDPLLKLDASSEEADLAAARANVDVMTAGIKVVDANIKLWESNVSRFEAAVAAKAAAATDLDNARAQLASARAQLERANAELAQAEARVGQAQAAVNKRTVKAPFDAKTGLRNIHPGQHLNEGEVFVTLQGLSDEIFLDFAVSQEHLARVSIGMHVWATSPVIGPDPIKITITAVNAVADPTTRNIRTRTVVDNRHGKLREGMFVNIRVPIEAPKQYVTVPVTAVRRASFGDHVFVVAPPPPPKPAKEGEPKPPAPQGPPPAFTAQQRSVRLGPVIGDRVIILDGLKAGEEIAAAGSFKLQDGFAVSKAAPAAPAGTGETKPPAKPEADAKTHDAGAGKSESTGKH